MDKVLLVEDEKHIAAGIELNLKLQGYQVSVAQDGEQALKLWQTLEPQLIILDIMLPKLNGLKVLRKIREQDQQLPILILSAKGAHQDKVKGFESGSDDYMTKPFELEELLLRVKRMLERSKFKPQAKKPLSNFEDKPFQFGANIVNFASRLAQTKDGDHFLTDNELYLLKYFIDHPNKPLTRDELLQAGWGYSEGTSTRTLDNFIVRFRKYFEDDPKKPLHFISIRSVGYQFNG